MPQMILGGRPRASSDGDILDDGLCGPLFVNLNDRSNLSEGPKRNSGGRTGYDRRVLAKNDNNSSSNNLNYSDDTFDSDSELSSQSSAKWGRKGLTFKSMRKAVSRVFVKDPTLAKKYEKNQFDNNNLSKVWTPDLRHLGEIPGNRLNAGELPYCGTSSTSRPLITSSSIGMGILENRKTPGTVGIYNHGNSCFMNAVLQCLSNTDSFTEYFIRDFFKNNLKNTSNGKKQNVFRSSHGEITEQLGHFLKCLWSGKYSSEVSKDFKSVVGKFNNQYKGDDQNDAQEFLLWLLDHIHEDVSTTTKKKKPHKVPVFRSDKELASEAASANGESFILRLFQALHSSTLTCPTCGECSTSFDPYLCVSLPLPQKSFRVVHVIVVYLDSHEVKMAFTLNQNDWIGELRELVSVDSKISIKQLLLVQLKDDCFGESYYDDQPLSDIPENEVVYAIEAHTEDATVASSTEEYDSPVCQLLVIHVEDTGNAAHSYRFGSPVMLKVRRDITWKSLQIEILKRMTDCLCTDIFNQTRKLSSLFMMRIYDGGKLRKHYLASDVEMPLYSQSMERAFSVSKRDSSPSHIKIIAEWDTLTKSRVVVDDKEHIEISSSVTKVQNNSHGQGKVSLEECFRLYTQEEKLIGDDAWLCPHCKQQQQGTIKTLGLWSLPDVLVLHLKRFKQTGPRRSKLNTLIDFPVDNLDMSSHLSRHSHGQPKWDDCVYDLIGVSNHYGNMMGGHYTAYCRNPVDGKWREYDDARVRLLEGPVATKEAYILFYQRRSLTKNVKQRLLTGSHWVYSLPLAPSEVGGKNSAVVQPIFSNEPTSQSPYTRSRSVSPNTRRRGSRIRNACIPTHSLTPQPIRRLVMPDVNGQDHSDESSSCSSPSSQKNTPSRRSHSLERQSSDSYSNNWTEASPKDSLPSRSKHHLGDQVNKIDHNVNKRDFTAAENTAVNQKLNGNITGYRPQTSDKTTDIIKSLPNTVIGNDSPRNSEVVTSIFNNKDLVSSTPRAIRHSPIVNVVMDSEPKHSPSSNANGASHLKQDNRNMNHAPQVNNDLPSDAGRKLAEIMKQDLLKKSQFKKQAEEQDSLINGSDMQSNLDRLSEVQLTNGLPEYRRRQQHASGLADNPASRKEGALRSDIPSQKKSATISRTVNTSHAGRYDQPRLPHSATDHNIRYSDSSYMPLSSSTVPHSHQEEHTAASSLSSLTNDYFTSSHSAGKHSTEHARQHMNHRNSLTSSGSQTLPGRLDSTRRSRYKFRPPRGVNFVQIEQPAKSVSSMSNACLKESSV